MNWFCVLAITFVGLGAAFGCMAENRPIPAGSYVSESRPGEEITVSPADITFRIKAKDRLVEKKSDYTVYTKDGEIQPKGLTSNDFMVGVGFYDWYWDGKAVLRKDARTGELIRYHKRSEGCWESEHVVKQG